MFSSHKYMNLALEEAKKAFKNNEVPIGAIIINEETGEIISTAHNLCETDNNPTKHAELIAIERATKHINNKNLSEYSIYVTLEPCPMCAQAISFARLNKLVYAADDEKSGGVENGAKIFEQSSCHHKPEIISGIMKNESQELLTEFFKNLR